eukprot:s4155_g2.t1
MATVANVEENQDAQPDSKTEESEVVVELKRLDDEMLEAQKERSHGPWMIPRYLSTSANISEDFEKAVQKLRREFQARQTPLIEQRDKVLWDGKDTEDPLTGTCLVLKPALKGFWVTVPLAEHNGFVGVDGRIVG